MILITGATSGIGEACARAFAAAGKNLWITGRRADRLEALAAELRASHRIAVKTTALDVRRREPFLELSRNEAEALATVETCIVNAGLALGLEPLQDGSGEDWEQMIDTNLKGALWTTELVLPEFRRRDRGHLIFMGSVAARWMYPKGNVYSATKAALHALAESLRLDLLGSRIRVSTLAPGLVETEFSRVRFKGDEKRAEAVYSGLEPLSPADIADAALWVATRPPHVTIQEMVIYPTAQASPSQVARSPVTPPR